MKLVLAAVLLSGCGFIIADPQLPEPSCVTVCGQKFFGEHSCAEYQDAEDRALTYLGPLFEDGSFVCRKLKDFKVSATKPEPWVDKWGRNVGGLSGCDVNPGQNGWATVLTDLHELSYFHEVMHHMQCPKEETCRGNWPQEYFDAVKLAAQ